MIRKRALLISTFELAFFVFFSSSVLALPMAEISYIETDLGGGNFQYEYIVANTSDPGMYEDFNIYDVFFEFDPAVSLTIVSLPTDWDAFAFPADPTTSGKVESLETFSFSPGVPPLGADIAPGSILGGFIFQFDLQLGNSPFEVLFANPEYSFEPIPVSGTTAPVPEPATILLLASGIFGMGVFGRKKLRR